MGGIAEKLKSLFSENKYTKLIVMLGICGILLIFFSNGKSEKVSEETVSAKSFDTDIYTENIEIKLKTILENIKGVGKSEIMVTISCTEEYVYAQEEKKDISEGSGKSSINTENKYVFNGSDKQALLKKVISPQINGVVIACEGGDKSSIAESVYESVSVALDIPISRIYVTSIE